MIFKKVQKIDVVTLFPEMFGPVFGNSIVMRAQKQKLVKIRVHNLRDWAIDKHNTVDDRPFGGGKGMVLMVEPVDKALKKLKRKNSKVILLTPQGVTYSQTVAKALSKEEHIILIAGHYEGFDERIRKHLIDEEISIGDYVLTGGEIAAMAIVDSIVRLIPGVLEKEAVENETFSLKDDKGNKLLDYPVYTRPETYKGWSVPEILLSGNHSQIEKWRKEESLKNTAKKRPDLIKR